MESGILRDKGWPRVRDTRARGPESQRIDKAEAKRSGPISVGKGWWPAAREKGE